MTGQTHKWRTNLLFVLMILSLVAMAIYLVGLIYRGRSDAEQMALRQQRISITVPARPGNIFARTKNRSVLLVGSRRVADCFIDHQVLPQRRFDSAAISIAGILNLDPIKLQQSFVTRPAARYVILAKNLTSKQEQDIRELNLPAVGISYRWMREYPNGSLAATVIGFRRRDNVAGGGLELSLDKQLSAVDGSRVALADARRRTIRTLARQSVTARDGNNVFLSLDAVIQGYLKDAVSDTLNRHRARWATGVVVEPATGRILAMCSMPNFDPNAYNTSRASDRNNRAINFPYEPGSAVKPLFAATAVDAGIMNYRTRIFCENGTYRTRAGGRISDHGSGYGNLSLSEVLVHSSNIGMAKVGKAMGNRAIWMAARRFGFGEKTGVDMPGESRGIVRPLKKWDGYSTCRVPFGQEISTTALQLTMGFCSLANGGLLLSPRIVDSIRDPSGKVIVTGKRRVVRRVLSASTAARTLKVLQAVVDRGTGKACRMRRWTSFGKTGTAQISGPGGYVDGAYAGTFVGGAPVNNTKVICLISVYWPDKSRGYYGGTVGAPYVKRVLQKTLSYLRVKPDKN